MHPLLKKILDPRLEKYNYNHETEKLKNLEQLKDLSFTLVDCWQNLDLLLWMVEAEEVIERKGRRTSYKTQL